MERGRIEKCDPDPAQAVAADLAEGVRRAQAALDSGAAAAVLDRLVRFTRRERAAEATG